MMKNLILCAFGLLVITGCAKYDDTQAAKNLQVPPYTETGANTFGCLMDGTVWANFGAYVSQGGVFTHPTSPSKVRSSIIYYQGTAADTLFVVGAQYSLVKNGYEMRIEHMSIQLSKNGSLKGTHQLLGTNDIFRYDKTNYSSYTSKARNPFTVIINKDSVVNGGWHIVSGRFYGVVYNYAQTDSVFISGGVFDTLTQ